MKCFPTFSWVKDQNFNFRKISWNQKGDQIQMQLDEGVHPITHYLTKPTTDYGHTKAKSLRPKFKSQSQISIYDVDVKA